MIGVLCSHIICAYKNVNLDKIPRKYIHDRWTKKASQKPIFKVANIEDKEAEENQEKKMLKNEIWSEFHSYVSLIEDDTEGLKGFLKLLLDQKEILEKDKGGETAAQTSKALIMEGYVGTKLPPKCNILPPKQAKNKGSGKRIKGRIEEAMEENEKPKRLCRNCNQYGRHDSRNCPYERE